MSKTYTIDAKGKKLGRIASEAASILMGKNTTTFVRNAIPSIKVEIVNVAQALISDKKKEEKTYANYSGFPGGLKVEKLGKVAAFRGYKEVFRRAVKGMLPKNKLQTPMMKNLIIKE